MHRSGRASSCVQAVKMVFALLLVATLHTLRDAPLAAEPGSAGSATGLAAIQPGTAQGAGQLGPARDVGRPEDDGQPGPGRGDGGPEDDSQPRSAQNARGPAPIQVGGVFPSLGAVAEHTPRTECGIGALMPWADRLWMVSYVAHTASTGSGTGLYEIDENLVSRKRPESVVGTYANRMVHTESNQLFIGPHAIDTKGNVRTSSALVPHRLTATLRHLTDPARKVYFLTMEGLLFEVDVGSLEAREIADLKKELAIQGAAHFKAGCTAQGRVVVANNSYGEGDVTSPGTYDGRLAEWDGRAWTIVERTAFCEVTGNGIQDSAIFATGWDRASVILKVFARGKWSTYRLPKGSQTHDHAWFTEWPRIREVETERFLLDMHGLFYELPALVYEGKVWGIRPICAHLRMVPDFCSWRGLLVLAGNQNSSMRDKNIVGGQPQSGLWFGKTDDLWRFGSPSGWGGCWWESAVVAGEPSDPYLMTGFDRKGLHLSHDSAEAVSFTIEVDFLGNQTWKPYAVVSVPPQGYCHHEFPAGFGAHWARLTADRDCRATAYFVYP